MIDGRRGIVADNDLNRRSEFWRSMIGDPIIVIREDADGLLAVSHDHAGLCDGIDPRRFDLSPAPAPRRTFLGVLRALWPW